MSWLTGESTMHVGLLSEILTYSCVIFRISREATEEISPLRYNACHIGGLRCSVQFCATALFLKVLLRQLHQCLLQHIQRPSLSEYPAQYSPQPVTATTFVHLVRQKSLKFDPPSADSNPYVTQDWSMKCSGRLQC